MPPLLYSVPVDHAPFGNPRRNYRESPEPESYRRRHRPLHPIQLSLLGSLDQIGAMAQDQIVVVVFSQIISPSILQAAPLGVVGFYNAVLPGRRGCSPVIWAMVEGLAETDVTMFFMASEIDTADMIVIETCPIASSDQAADVLAKADQSTLALISRKLGALLEGTAPRRQQTPGARDLQAQVRLGRWRERFVASGGRYREAHPGTVTILSTGA